MENKENTIVEEVNVTQENNTDTAEVIETSAETPTTANNKKNKNIIVIIAVCVILLFTVGGGFISGVIGIVGGIIFNSDYSFDNGGVSDEMYIGVAKQIISKSLKKPSSLEVNDAYVYEKDEYGSAIVCMDITSENSYGGADRDTVYVCVMYLKSDGSYKFNSTWNFTEDITNLEFLKNINGFGEPEE